MLIEGSSLLHQDQHWMCMNQCPTCGTMGKVVEHEAGTHGDCALADVAHYHLNCQKCGRGWQMERD